MPLNMISEEDFTKLSQFIHKEYGINLAQKKQLVTSRLSSFVSQKGYTSFTPFVSALLKERNPADMEAVLNRLTTNYTFFMRETEHFEFFTRTVLPEIVNRHQRDRVMSIWSAGCSSGEEPYNLSIYIKEFLRPSGIPGSWPPTSPRRPWPARKRASTSCPTLSPATGRSVTSSPSRGPASSWWRRRSKTT